MRRTPNVYFGIPDPMGPVATVAKRLGVTHANTAIYGAMLWMGAVVSQGSCPLQAEVTAYRIFRQNVGGQRARLAVALHLLHDELFMRQPPGPAGPP